MRDEIHLFVLWEKVGPARESILHRIQAEFEVLRVFRVRWSPALFAANLSRFYGQKLPVGCDKEASCGTGPFTLVVVRDTRPDYALRTTTRGPARVNVRTFDLKAFYRSPAGGGLPIHASDTAREAAHDLALLLGMGTADFAAAHPGAWNGEIQTVHRNVSGALGWESLAELFAVLNETIDYVVLRNFECLPARHRVASHGDIDLLVDQLAEACLITNATPVYREPYRVHMSVLVGGEAVPFDFRHVGDDYYDARWQRRMLESRERVAGGFFVPDAIDHFYSLLYHAAVHKPAIAPDYATRLHALAAPLNLNFPAGALGEPASIRRLLLDHMRPHGYRFTRPLDPTVYFNTAIACTRWERLMQNWMPRKTPAASPQDIPASRLPVRALANEQASDPARANLLRPFHFHAGQSILELGCEGGVLTRLLGESGATVVAIESAPTLAALAEAHCRDLANVRVILDDPLSAAIDERFDVVCLIGTPERSAPVDATADPVGACIARATALLKPDGLLILAIDNQFGLKYFNGCPEERTGIPFFGINDLYAPGDPVTIGRHALAEKLAHAGFTQNEFLFPFPDYRQAGLILGAAALREPALNVADLLIHNTGKARPETHHRAFAEDLAWRVAARNGLLADLANSFLVLARRDAVALPPTDWLAKMYSRGRRHPCYRIESSIERHADGALRVSKRRLFPDAPTPAAPWLRHAAGDSDYLAGSLNVARIHQAMAREADIDELAAAFGPWLRFLRAHATTDAAGSHCLPGEFVDCIPANLIETFTGELRYFDAEWVSDAPIPLVWVAVRGIIYALIDCLENTHLRQTTYRQFATRIAQGNGLNLGAEDFALADRCESRLMEQCHADQASTPRLADFLDNPLFLTVRLAQHSPDYRHSLAWHQAELARVKKTVSWRITAPLRVVWNLGLRLFPRGRGTAR